MRMMTTGRENRLTTDQEQFPPVDQLGGRGNKVPQILLCTVTYCTLKMPINTSATPTHQGKEKEDHLLEAPPQLRKETLPT